MFAWLWIVWLKLSLDRSFLGRRKDQFLSSLMVRWRMNIKTQHCGAVLVDIVHGKYFVFGDKVSQELLDKWQSSGKRQVISQTELYPIVVAKRNLVRTSYFQKRHLVC